MRFSIIVPVYNAAAWLERCISSVLAQACGSWELLLVDDGSSDDSWKLLLEWKKRDSRIRVFHQENSGQFLARRKGIREAKGDYLLFLDCDDALEEHCLSVLEQELQEEAWDILLYQGKILSDGHDTGRRIGALGARRRRISPREFREYLIAGQSLNSLCIKTFRRELFAGDETDADAFRGICYGEDKAALLHPASKAENLLYLPETLYCYYHRLDSLVHSHSRERIAAMLGNEMFSLLHRYMQEWKMNGAAQQEQAAVYYLRNYLMVYYHVRKSCRTRKEKRAFRHFPWKQYLEKKAFRYRFSGLLSGKEKLKLLLAEMRI